MNLILTAMTGNLKTAEIEPFFASLRQSGCPDEVVVFASNISDECRSMLQQHRARVIDFEYKGIPVLKSRTQRLWCGLKKIGGYYLRRRGPGNDFDHLIINNSRFFHCHKYLKGLEVKPENVLLADIRDVVFQSNPFSHPFKPGLSVATECRTIGQSRMGIKQLFMVAGVRETRRLCSRDIINCGTIVADYGTIMKCLDLYIVHFNRKFFWGLIDAIDQALLTYLAYNEMVSPVHVFHNWQGPFLTMDSLTVRPENKNADGYLCNQDGSIIPIVHQYDRIQGLYKKGEAVPPCWEFYAR